MGIFYCSLEFLNPMQKHVCAAAHLLDFSNPGLSPFTHHFHSAGELDGTAQTLG
jgi:hypothetical protein